MSFRSFRVDLFRHTFPRFVIGSIFIVACFLLLSLISDSRLSNRQDKIFGRKLDYLKNDTKPSQVHRKLGGSHKLFFDSENPDTATVVGTRSRTKSGARFFEEDFPEVQASPSVSSVLAAFYKKVALRDRKLINPHNFNYIHNVPNACVGRKIELLVGVPTRTDSFEARQAIRETWGEYGTVPTNNAVILFFLGSTRDKSVRDKIDAEAEEYGDIVQEDFLDSYRNLSLKTVALMKWVSTYCSDSTFVLKADDDMYINVPRLVLKLREQLKRGPVFLVGALHYSTAPFRDRNNKWSVTKEEYPSRIFPNYLSGTAYAMTTSAALRLYVESLYVKNLFLEDVYLTGMVADRAAVPRVREKDFNPSKLDPEGCSFKKIISGHKNSPDEIRKIHRELFDPDLRCNED